MTRTRLCCLALVAAACTPDRSVEPEPETEAPPVTMPPAAPEWRPYDAPEPIAAAEQDWTPRMSEPIRIQPRYRPVRIEGPRLLAAKDASPSPAFVYDAASDVRVELTVPLASSRVEIDPRWRYLAVQDAPGWTLFELTSGSTVATFEGATALVWTRDGEALVGLADDELVAYVAPEFERRSLADDVATHFTVTERGVVAEREGRPIYRSVDGVVAYPLPSGLVRLAPDRRRALLGSGVLDLDSGAMLVENDHGIAYADATLTRAAYVADRALYAWREGSEPERVAVDVDAVAVARVTDDGVVWADTPDGPHTVYRTARGVRTQLARGVVGEVFSADASLERVVFASRIGRTEIVDGTEHHILYDWDRYAPIDDDLETLVLYADEATALYDFATQTVVRVSSTVQSDAEGYLTAVMRGAGVDVYRGVSRVASLEAVDPASVEVRGGFVFARDALDALFVIGADHDAPVKVADEVWAEAVSGDWVYYVDRDDVLMARKLR